MVEGLQLIVAILLMVLGVIIVVTSGKGVVARRQVLRQEHNRIR